MIMIRRWCGVRAARVWRTAACGDPAVSRALQQQQHACILDSDPPLLRVVHVPTAGCWGFASSALLPNLHAPKPHRASGPTRGHSQDISTLSSGRGRDAPAGGGAAAVERGQGGGSDGLSLEGGASLEEKKNKADEEELAGWGYGDVVNAANIVSMARLISGPFLGYGIVEGMWGPVLVGAAVSSWSDWLDGYLARRYQISSRLGSYLDPLADKALVCSLVVALAHEGLMYPPLAALFLGRDVLLVGGAFAHRSYMLNWQWPGWREYFRLSGNGEVGAMPVMRPLFVSKVNTVLQLSLIGACITQGAFAWPGDDALWLLGASAAGTTVASTGCYVADYFKGKTLGRPRILSK